jgi:cell wall assembly regulator SMI1
LDRASQFAKNLREGTVVVDDYDVQPYNKESSSHRARQDDINMGSSSDEEEDVKPSSHKNTKKAFRKRTTRSKKFNESLKLAKVTKMALVQIHDVDQTKKIFEIDQHGKQRLVEIEETVSCNCSFASKKDVCLHVIWVLINVLEVNVNDNLLHQKSHSKETVHQLFRTLVESSSSETSPRVDHQQATTHNMQSSHTISRPRVPQSQPLDSNVLQPARLPLSSGSSTNAVANPNLNGQSYPFAARRYPSSHTISRPPQSEPLFDSNVLQPAWPPVTSGSSTNVVANPNLNGQSYPGAARRYPSSHTISRTPQSVPPFDSNVLQPAWLPLTSDSSTNVVANPNLNGQSYPGAARRYPSSHTISRPPQSVPPFGSNVLQPAWLPLTSDSRTNVVANPNLNGQRYPDAARHYPSSHTISRQPQSNLPQPPLSSSSCTNSSPAVISLTKPPWQNNNRFMLHPLNNRIKKCADCPFEFRDPLGPLFLGVVLQHKERDVYIKDGKQHISAEQNRYYHCKLGCIKHRHPYFTSSLVTMHPDLLLTQFQIDAMFTEIGLTI